jgi:hypothetical protein
MNSIVVDVEIKGVAPLLQHNIDGGEQQMLGKGKRKTSGVANDEEEWKRFLYRADGTGRLGHPSSALESLFVKAARDFKADKRRTMAEIAKATMFCNETLFEIVGKTGPDRVNRSSVVNPNTRGRGFRYRPEFDAGWIGRVSITIADLELMPEPRAKEILEHGGRLIGIGDWRPKFGRFIVTKWKVRK